MPWIFANSTSPDLPFQIAQVPPLLQTLALSDGLPRPGSFPKIGAGISRFHVVR